MKYAVIVARMQIGEPHEGHKFLINYAKEHSDKLLFVLGESQTRINDKHPLPFSVREIMMKEYYPECRVLKLPDFRSDETWTEKLDELINYNIPSKNEITLYCSRDGFKSAYTGKYPVIEVETPVEQSATEIRAELARIPPTTKEGRNAVIWASQYKYPAAFPCVDVALIKFYGTVDPAIEDPKVYTSHMILIGRKHGEDIWRLPGGFVDPTDESYEAAAQRELGEECGHVNTHGFKYVCSKKINDWRYRGSKDGIISSLFLTYFMSGAVCAGDDLEEVKWVTLAEAEATIAPFHLELVRCVIKKINE